MAKSQPREVGVEKFVEYVICNAVGSEGRGRKRGYL